MLRPVPLPGEATIERQMPPLSTSMSPVRHGPAALADGSVILFPGLHWADLAGRTDEPP